MYLCLFWFFFFQAEDGIRDLVRSRGLGDVYKRQIQYSFGLEYFNPSQNKKVPSLRTGLNLFGFVLNFMKRCLVSVEFR